MFFKNKKMTDWDALGLITQEISLEKRGLYNFAQKHSHGVVIRIARDVLAILVENGVLVKHEFNFRLAAAEKIKILNEKDNHSELSELKLIHNVRASGVENSIWHDGVCNRDYVRVKRDGCVASWSMIDRDTE